MQQLHSPAAPLRGLSKKVEGKGEEAQVARSDLLKQLFAAYSRADDTGLRCSC